VASTPSQASAQEYFSVSRRPVTVQYTGKVASGSTNAGRAGTASIGRIDLLNEDHIGMKSRQVV